MVRTTVAALGGGSILFIGIIALSEAASQSEEVAMETSAGTDAWNTATAVFDGLGQAAAPGVILMGVAAVIIVALGFLVTSSTGGR